MLRVRELRDDAAARPHHVPVVRHVLAAALSTTTVASSTVSPTTLAAPTYSTTALAGPGTDPAQA